MQADQGPVILGSLQVETTDPPGAGVGHEQADFQVTDHRSDLFSAGVVLAHLLVGRNVFNAMVLPALALEARHDVDGVTGLQRHDRLLDVALQRPEALERLELALPHECFRR